MKNDNLFNSPTYKALYKTITSEADLRKKLEKMPARYGVTVEDSKALAEECMRAAAEYEYVRDTALDGNLDSFLNDALNKCGSDYYERMRNLHRINFGLSLYSDIELVGHITNGANVEELFNDYMKEDAKAPLSEAEIVQSIRNHISHNCLSSQELSAYTIMLLNKNDMFGYSAMMSESSYSNKCILAMDEYLRGNSENVTLAVYKVCEECDLQSLSYALKKGSITDNTACKYIRAFGIVLLILTVAAVIVAAEEAVKLAVFLGIIGLTASFIAYVFPDCISAPIGRLKAKHSYSQAVAKAEAERNCNVYEHKTVNEDHLLPEQLQV